MNSIDIKQENINNIDIINNLDNIEQPIEDIKQKKERKPRAKKEKIIKEIIPKEKIILKCNKCNLPILKKYYNMNICHDCRYELSKKYYQVVIKPNKIKVPRKKTTIEFIYPTNKGDIIVNAVSENKTCKKCNETKYYTEFTALKERHDKYYLSPRCKKCQIKYYIKNPNRMRDFIEKEINTNN